MEPNAMPVKDPLAAQPSASPQLGAAIVLAVGLVLSLFLWHHASRNVARNAETLLGYQSSLLEAGLLQRLNEFESILLGMQGLYVASGHVSRDAFRRYLDNLRLQGRTGGIRALHFTRHVTRQGKAAFVAAVRGDRSQDPQGYPDFAIHPEGERSEYFFIEYIEPFAENRRAFGLDAGTQAANRESLIASRDSGRTYLTPPFQLVQTRPGELGLVLRAPVYRNGAPLDTVGQRRAALTGFVGITLEADGIFGDILAAPAYAGLRAVIRDLGSAVADVAAGTEPQEIAGGGSNITALLANTRTVEANGRLWELSLAAGETWLAAVPGRHQGIIFLTAGTAISLLLAALYILLARGKARAIRLADDMTRNLREQTTLLRIIFDHMNQGISVVDADLKMIGCNRRFFDLLGFPEHLNCVGTPFESFIRFNAERGEYGAGDIETQVRERIDLARRFQPHSLKRTRPDGSVIEVIGTPLQGGGMVTTYTDITEQERTQDAVRRERDFRQHLIESIPGIFYLMDAEGHFLLQNRNFEAVTGYTPEEISRLHPLDFFEGNDRQLIEERIGATFEHGSASAEALFKAKDGSKRPYFFTGRRIALEDGRPGLVGVGIDITEQKHVEEVLARQSAVLQATLEAMDQGISVVDADLRMIALNRRFCELLDFPESIARVGADFADFIRFNAERGEYGPCDVEERVREMMERARHVTPHCFRRIRPNGCILEVRGNPLPGGGFVTTYTDVTEQEQAQQAIRELNESLERRVQERTAELEASNRELEAFSYSVSHDLRAPLRALHGFSYMLEEEYRSRLDENGLDYLRRIQAASARMGDLIDDLIEMARISRQDLTRVSVNLTALASSIRQTIEEQQADRSIDWRIAQGLNAHADPVLANALLENLLRNAWKFSSERADACIEFSAYRDNGETVFTVKDNGVGFEMTYADKLFKPFQRLHDAKQFEGTGIGLAIVQRIVRRHGGRVWAESQPGQGAAFYFTLP